MSPPLSRRSTLRRLAESSTYAPVDEATWTTFAAQAAGWVAHRGNRMTNPENSIVAFRSAVDQMVAAGRVPALKTDVQTLGDGATIIMHNSTLDTITSGTGSVSAYTSATINTVKVAAISMLGPAWTNPSIPFLYELLNEFGHKALLWLDPKTTAALPAIISEVKRRSLQGSVVLCDGGSLGATLTYPALCAAQGISPVCAYQWVSTSITTVTPATVIAAGYKALGVNITMTDADIATVVAAGVAAGIPVHGFTYQSRYDYTRMSGLGVKHHLGDDIAYQASTTALKTGVGASHTFAAGAMPSATLTSNTTQVFGWPGSTGSYRLQQGAAGGTTQSGSGSTIGLGQLTPFSNTTAYTYTGTLYWDGVDTDPTRFQAVCFMVDDRAAGFNLNDGYVFLIRQNGQPAIQRQNKGAYQGNGTYAAGATSAIATGTTGPAITAGQSLPFTIQKTGTGTWSFTINGQTISAGDTTYTPVAAFWSVGRTSGSGGLVASITDLTRTA